MKRRIHNMKKILSLFLISIITFFGSLINNVKANEEPPSSTFIDSFEEDITGDGLREYFKLQGRYLAEDSNYYQDIWLEITSPFAKEWSISFKGGYDPKLTLYDLNHDQVFDLLYEVALDEEKERFFTQAYSLKKGKVEQIELPSNNYIKGEYLDDFRIALTLHANEDPIFIPVKNRQQLIDNKLYDTNGKILKEESIVVDPIKKFIPTLISESKGYGLKSIQEINGVFDEDRIGSIETLWYYDKNKWIILQNNWKPQ